MYVLPLLLIYSFVRRKVRIYVTILGLKTCLYPVDRSDIPCNLETKVCETTDSTVGDIVNYSRVFDKDILVSGTNARLSKDFFLKL